MKDAKARAWNSAIGLQPGDTALTDYNGRGLQLVLITARKDGTRSQTGVCFQVEPPLKNCVSASWIDAGWFQADMVAHLRDCIAGG